MGGFMTPNPTPSMEEIRSLVQALVAEALNQRDQQTVVAQQVESLLSQLPQKSGSGRSIECVPGRSIMPLMVRWRQDGAATKYDINLATGTSVMFQNGVAIAVDTAELAQLGTTAWYNLTTCDGADAVTDLYAVAIPNVGGSSGAGWQVNPDAYVKVRFYTNLTIAALSADQQAGFPYGLKKHLAKITARSIVWQAVSGETTSAACMGDGDRNNVAGTQDVDSSSIVQVARGQHQIADFASADMTANTDMRFLVRKKIGSVFQTGISDLLAGTGISLTKGSGGVTVASTATEKIGDADAVGPTQKSIHTRGGTGDFEVYNLNSSDMAADANTRLLVRKTTGGVMQTGVSILVAGDGIVFTPGASGFVISVTPATVDNYGNPINGNPVLGDGYCTWCPGRWNNGVPADGDGGVVDGDTNNQAHPGTGGTHAGSGDTTAGSGGVVTDNTHHPYTCPPCLYGKTLPP